MFPEDDKQSEDEADVVTEDRSSTTTTPEKPKSQRKHKHHHSTDSTHKHHHHKHEHSRTRASGQSKSQIVQKTESLEQSPLASPVLTTTAEDPPELPASIDS